MDDQMKKRRDEEAKDFEADDFLYPKTGPANSFRKGWDACARYFAEKLTKANERNNSLEKAMEDAQHCLEETGLSLDGEELRPKIDEAIEILVLARKALGGERVE